MIQEILNVITWMLVAAILAIAAWATMYIKNSSRSTKLIEKRRWIGQIPSALSTLGVLGTFIGITIGLCNFDTTNLDESIPLLLSGLKTAFFTSIAGMGTSMYLSKLVSNLYDKTDKGVSDINIAAGLITKAVSEMSTDNIETLHTMMGLQEKQLQLFERIHQDQIAAVELLKANKDSNAVLVNGLKIINANIKEGVGEIKELGNHINCLENSIQAEFRGLNTVVKTQFGEFETFIDKMNTKIAGDILQKLGVLETKSEQAYDLLHNISSDTSNISSINDNVATSLEALGNLDASEQHVSEEIDKLSGVLQTEVGELNTVVKSQFAELSAFINKVNTKIADDILQKLGMLETKSGQAYDLLHSISSDTSNISSINDNVATSLEALGNLDASEQHVSEEIDKLSGVLQTEVGELNTVVKSQFAELSAFINKVNTKIADDILQKLGILETKSGQAYDLLHSISSDTSNISSINDNVATSLEALGNLDASEQHVSEEIDKLSGVLQTEVGELNTVVKSQFAELSAFINKVNTKIADDILQKLGMLEAKTSMAYDLLHSISSDTSNISSINDNVAISLEALGNLDASEQHVSEEIDKLSGVLQTEVGELNTVVKSQFAELSAFINKVNTKIADDILQKLGILETKSGQAYDLLHSISSDTSNISSINDNVATSLEALGNLDASEQHVSEEIDKLGEKMGQDISNIVVRMDDTDKLLSNKLNEFTKLLEKNNVDALSEYLKKFATDFQKQMNVLINKLVTDNFKELNKSIDNLNSWQQENKTMVADMIKQYREMVVNFEDTSSTMSDVSKTIDKLVSDGGKFSDLIQALNEVMLEDKNFVRVIDKLKEAAEINHDNSVTLNQSANSLNGWIVTQKNFVRGVERLIAKLDEISKFKDYNSEFWTDTKKKLQEGVNMLNKGSEQLNSQVAVIDKQFYARLNTTLANLDACIQAMYNGKIR